MNAQPPQRSPERIREWILLATRDIIPPLTGVFLSVYLPIMGQFEAWQLPLIAGLLGIPLVAPPPAERPLVMIDRLPCKPRPTSFRPLAEWVAICGVASALLYFFGA